MTVRYHRDLWISCLPSSSTGMPSWAVVRINSSLQDSSNRIAWSRNDNWRNVGTLFAQRTHNSSSLVDPSYRPVIKYFICLRSLTTNRTCILWAKLSEGELMIASVIRLSVFSKKKSRKMLAIARNIICITVVKYWDQKVKGQGYVVFLFKFKQNK